MPVGVGGRPVRKAGNATHWEVPTGSMQRWRERWEPPIPSAVGACRSPHFVVVGGRHPRGAPRPRLVLIRRRIRGRQVGRAVAALLFKHVEQRGDEEMVAVDALPRLCYLPGWLERDKGAAMTHVLGHGRLWSPVVAGRRAGVQDVAQVARATRNQGTKGVAVQHWRLGCTLVAAERSSRNTMRL